MKLRTLSQLQDALDNETSWRKQELTHIRFLIDRSNSVAESYALRAGIALLYAHWEGWIRAIARLYIEYVNQKKLTFNEMSPDLLGGALKTRISEISESSKARSHREFARFICGEELNQVARLSDSLVQTGSNLSSEVLSDIMVRLGLPEGVFELEKAFIDARVVHRRNVVAHGEFLSVDRSEFLSDLEKTRDMLSLFADLVSNAACTEAYRRR